MSGSASAALAMSLAVTSRKSGAVIKGLAGNCGSALVSPSVVTGKTLLFPTLSGQKVLLPCLASTVTTERPFTPRGLSAVIKRAVIALSGETIGVGPAACQDKVRALLYRGRVASATAIEALPMGRSGRRPPITPLKQATGSKAATVRGGNRLRARFMAALTPATSTEAARENYPL